MNTEKFKNYLLNLQDQICDELSKAEGGTPFTEDLWEKTEGLRGGGRTRVLAKGKTIEKGGVNFSHVMGDSLPPSATARNPDLAGRQFEAMGVSLVIHPENPYVPTSHANFRLFVAQKENEDPIWWFGGGYDLTPYYVFEEDAVHWHQTAKDACDKHGEDIYPHFKKWCDDYFYLKHRKETRGVGGLFFDDFNKGSYEDCFKMVQDLGDSYLKAYLPIFEKRKDLEYGDRERDFQLYRRGRYVEYNLVFDRGTLFGLQSGGRTESILMSLPPLVRWEYDFQPEAGSPEEKLIDYLKPKDWLNVT